VCSTLRLPREEMAKEPVPIASEVGRLREPGGHPQIQVECGKRSLFSEFHAALEHAASILRVGSQWRLAGKLGGAVTDNCFPPPDAISMFFPSGPGSDLSV
jgi:hypothetical protein